jgi:hypothetical protein
MKIRYDYVSNSSSSSYIIELPKPVEQYTLEEFKSLFASDKVLEKLYNELKTINSEPIEGRRYHVEIDNWSNDWPENSQRILNENFDDSTDGPIKRADSYQ